MSQRGRADLGIFLSVFNGLCVLPWSSSSLPRGPFGSVWQCVWDLVNLELNLWRGICPLPHFTITSLQIVGRELLPLVLSISLYCNGEVWLHCETCSDIMQLFPPPRHISSIGGQGKKNSDICSNYFTEIKLFWGCVMHLKEPQIGQLHQSNEK